MFHTNLHLNITLIRRTRGRYSSVIVEHWKKKKVLTRCRLRSSKVKQYARTRLRRLTMADGNTAEIPFHFRTAMLSGWPASTSLGKVSPSRVPPRTTEATSHHKHVGQTPPPTIQKVTGIQNAATRYRGFWLSQLTEQWCKRFQQLIPIPTTTRLKKTAYWMDWTISDANDRVNRVNKGGGASESRVVIPRHPLPSAVKNAASETWGNGSMNCWNRRNPHSANGPAKSDGTGDYSSPLNVSEVPGRAGCLYY
jgi:hypothetical protein